MTDNCWVCLNCETWAPDEGQYSTAPVCSRCGAKMYKGSIDPSTGIPIGMEVHSPAKPRPAWYARKYPTWLRAVAWGLLAYMLNAIWYYIIAFIIQIVFAVSLLQMLFKLL